MKVNKNGPVHCIIFVVFTLAVGTARAQSNLATSDCKLVEANRTAQFISYVTHSEGDSYTLRLHNNTTCSLVVQTDDQFPTGVKRPPGGRLGIEPITEWEEGVKLSIHYLVQRANNAPERAYGWGDSVFTFNIPPGASVLFTVSRKHLGNRINIAVPFNYSWEANEAIGMGVGGVVHRVYFLADDLPKQRKGSTK